MAQNINNVQYVHMANPGVGQAPPPGQTYQLPPNSLVGPIGMGRSNPQSRSTTNLKANMGIGGDANKHLYAAWRDCAKDLMLARNYVPGPRAMTYPDADFQPIVAGMRRLRPACDQLATASAANNLARIQDIDEAVVHLVKDCVRKLFNTVKTNGAPPGQPGVPFAQVIVPGILLSTNIPAQWGLATAVPNVAPVPQNVPPGNPPPGAPLPPAPPAIIPAPAPPPPAPPAIIPAPAPPPPAPPGIIPAPAPLPPAQPADGQAQAPNAPVPPVGGPAPGPIVPAPPGDDPGSPVDDPGSPVDDPALPALLANRQMANRMPTG